MTHLEKRKKEVELQKVKAARMELELKIDERLDEIERIKEHIKIQIEKEQSLEQELKS
jgi:hypothetical protein